MQCVRDTHCIRPAICSTQFPVKRSRSFVCRSKSCIVRAARSSGGEEREQALRQQWQEAVPEDQQGPYEGGPYGGPYGNGQYYQQQYPGYQYGAAPQPSSGGVPWGWVIFGGIAAIVVSKVVDFFSPSGGGPQAKMMNFMMKQAMKGAGGGGGGGGGMPSGFPDFSQLGGAGMPGSFPGSGFPSAPSTSSSQKAASSPVVDTQARSVNQTAGSSSPSSPSEATSDGTRRGAKFEEMKEKSRRRRRDGPAASPSAAFTDVDQEEKASTSTAASGGAADEQDDSATMEMLEQFIQDPNMQQLLYQYLPEPMRNKETFEWMLKNPEYRAQLQSMIKAQGAQLNPEVYKQMQGIDSEQVTRQLAEHGMTPADVIKKIMSEPELATAFSKPQVQQAIMELQSNPMAMLKYQDDPDVMLVFEKMSQMFPQMGGGPEAMAGS